MLTLVNRFLVDRFVIKKCTKVSITKVPYIGITLEHT